jgi:vacuolar-type H+-ATPase subunit E/Vma4
VTPLVPAAAPAADPLAPVREALLARARAEADTLLTAADATVAAALDSARADAEALLRQARSQGEADAAGVLADERTRTRRRARTVVLTAERQAHDELRRRVRTGVAALADDPGYAAVRTALGERARSALGAGATVRDDRAGGLVAEAGDRQVAYRLADLAVLAVDELGPDVEGLWAP